MLAEIWTKNKTPISFTRAYHLSLHIVYDLYDSKATLFIHLSPKSIVDIFIRLDNSGRDFEQSCIVRTYLWFPASLKKNLSRIIMFPIKECRYDGYRTHIIFVLLRSREIHSSICRVLRLAAAWCLFPLHSSAEPYIIVPHFHVTNHVGGVHPLLDPQIVQAQLLGFVKFLGH